MVMEADGTKRTAHIDDYIRMAKLFHLNPLITVNGGVLVHPGELPPPLSPLLMYYMALLYSDKCLKRPRETAIRSRC